MCLWCKKYQLVLVAYNLSVSQQCIIQRANAHLDHTIALQWSDQILQYSVSRPHIYIRTKKVLETMSPGEWLKMFILVEELEEFKIVLNMKGNFFFQ